jgi:hypothetical protein
MIAAYISLIAGAVVSLAYLIAVWRGLISAKQEMARYGGAQIGEIKAVDDQVFRAQESGILWKSVAGVVLSTAALVVLILSPSFWYLVPFLGIGTAVAVIAAFAVESRSDRAPPASA